MIPGDSPAQVPQCRRQGCTNPRNLPSVGCSPCRQEWISKDPIDSLEYWLADNPKPLTTEEECRSAAAKQKCCDIPHCTKPADPYISWIDPIPGGRWELCDDHKEAWYAYRAHNGNPWSVADWVALSSPGPKLTEKQVAAVHSAAASYTPEQLIPLHHAPEPAGCTCGADSCGIPHSHWCDKETP